MSEQQELDIDATVGDIAADIGITHDDAPPTEDAAPQEDTPTQAHQEDKPEEDTPPPQPQVRSAPKAWAKEHHERWAKLDKETQDYIELREKQIADGMKGFGEASEKVKQWDEAVRDYMPIIEAQGVTPQHAVKYLFEAHKNLSVGTPEQKAAYLKRVADTYGIDISKVGAAPADEPPAVRELRERTERLERERQAELRERQEAEKTRIASEVAAFADAKDEKGNPKHPYFDECADHIARLIKAGSTLEEAYETAIWANPVTKEKELQRLRTEEEAALRAKAKQEAERARHASRTNVSSRDTRRTPTAPAGKWEDTLEQTYREIQSKAH
jgi:hypothetical protein